MSHPTRQMDAQIERALDHFLLAKRSSAKAEKTVSEYERLIGNFINSLPESRQTIQAVEALDIEKFLEHQRERGLKPYSIDAYWRSLRAFFNWLLIRPEYDFSLSPITYVERPRRGKAKIVYVKFEEYQALFKSIKTDFWLDARDRLIVEILFWSGLRISELADLQLGDIDTEKGLLTVYHGKGGKARDVPISKDVKSLLDLYLITLPCVPLEPSTPLLMASDGYLSVRGKLTPDGIRQMFIRRCHAGNIRYMNPHSWRHGFAMAMLNAGASMSAVSAMLGHYSVTLTESVYAHWLTDGLVREHTNAARRLTRK